MAEYTEDTHPKFWMHKIIIPERACQKVDPSIFIEKFVHPFMKDLAQAISRARLVGRTFYLEAHIRFPEFVQLGVSDEKGKQSVENQSISKEDKPEFPGIVKESGEDRKEG